MRLLRKVGEGLLISFLASIALFVVYCIAVGALLAAGYALEPWSRIVAVGLGTTIPISLLVWWGIESPSQGRIQKASVTLGCLLGLTLFLHGLDGRYSDGTIRPFYESLFLAAFSIGFRAFLHARFGKKSEESGQDGMTLRGAS